MAVQPATPRPRDDAELAAPGMADALVDLLKRQRRRRGPDDPPRKLSAIRLAAALGVRPRGNVESRKRGVRIIVERARKAGTMISADAQGYWWPDYLSDHATYRRHRHRQAMTHLAAESADRRSPAAAASAGQLALFAGGPGS
jgi:hypothetical protein